ncbi:MAG: PilZ domain-containing protein [Polyangiaceae bacterium]|nr:PilZ domain-containing protein [Polyangiaceae bacterium]
MFERRNLGRRPANLLFNRFVEGQPYLSRLVDLSETGLCAETFVEPVSDRFRCTVEIMLPEGDSIWIWAKRVWGRGNLQGLSFLGLAPDDAQKLRAFALATAPGR